METIRVKFKGHCALEGIPRATDTLTPNKEYNAILISGNIHSQDMLALRDDNDNLIHLFRYRFKDVA